MYEAGWFPIMQKASRKRPICINNLPASASHNTTCPILPGLPLQVSQRPLSFLEAAFCASPSLTRRTAIFYQP